MYDWGSGNFGDAVDGMYNFYEVTCLSEGIPAMGRDGFITAVVRGYEYYRDHYNEIIRDNKRVKVVFNKLGEIDFLWVEYGEMNQAGDIDMYLVRNPEVQNG